MKHKLKTRKKRHKYYVWKYFLYFIIFSFAGSLIEYLFGFLGGTGTAYDKGLYQLFNIKLFFIPFYGLAALLLIFFEKFLDKKKIKFAFHGVLNGMVIIIWELIGGLFCLLVFGQRLWDYSGQPFNFLGLISLKMFFFWIFIGYIFSFVYRYIIKPSLDKG